MHPSRLIHARVSACGTIYVVMLSMPEMVATRGLQIIPVDNHYPGNYATDDQTAIARSDQTFGNKGMAVS